MKGNRYFHHPDFSLPVVARRSTEKFVELLCWYGEVFLSAGRALYYNGSCFSSKTSYYTARSRLKKDGILAYNSLDTRWPVLQLTDEWKTKVKTLHKPNSFWNKKWSGVWNVLVYDVPEENRSFRDNLRRVLERYRMGFIQKSVWVSPWDMRPVYDDLNNTAHIEFVSYLFEAQTVLGRSKMDIVEAAWDFEYLKKVQKWYMRLCQKSICNLRTNQLSKPEVVQMACEEIEAYEAAMSRDPLLPRELYPSDYEGEDVFNWHKDFVNHAKGCLAE